MNQPNETGPIDKQQFKIDFIRNLLEQISVGKVEGCMNRKFLIDIKEATTTGYCNTAIEIIGVFQFFNKEGFPKSRKFTLGVISKNFFSGATDISLGEELAIKWDDKALDRFFGLDEYCEFYGLNDEEKVVAALRWN